MNQNSTKAIGPDVQSPMMRSIGRLYDCTQDLSMAVEDLSRRLEPILMPESPETKSDCAPRPSNSTTGFAIEKGSDDVYNAVMALRKLIERLGV